MDGSIYQWCTQTGDRLQEFCDRQKPVACGVSTLDDKIYSVGRDGYLREVFESQLERSFDSIGMSQVNNNICKFMK